MPEQNRFAKQSFFLAANPASTSQLRLDEEAREIEAGLQRSKYRDRFELRHQWAVHPQDIQRSLLDHQLAEMLSSEDISTALRSVISQLV